MSDRPNYVAADGTIAPLTDAMYAQWQADAQAAASAPVPAAQVTSLQFLALFTAAEQTAIVGSTDPQVRLFMWMAAGASTIDLGDPRTQNGIAYLVSVNLLTQARSSAILAGTPPG